MATKKTAKKISEDSVKKEEKKKVSEGSVKKEEKKKEKVELSKSSGVSALLPVHSRIQTAEGWRRSQLKRRQEKQQKARG